jgi:hypothetical protein
VVTWEVVAVRRWQLGILVAVAVAALAVAGRLAGPPASPQPAAPPLVDTRPTCDPDGGTRRPAGPADGPQLHPPVAGLRLVPATPRPGDLAAGRAQAMARELVGSHVDAIRTHARLLRVTRPPTLRHRRAWVVAVTGVPVGMGFCGPVGSREVVLVLDAATGAQLWRYSYR